MKDENVRIGITLGDPAGIGPEISVKALQEIQGTGILPVLIARKEVLREWFPEFLQRSRIAETEEQLQKLLASHDSAVIIYDVPLTLPIPTPGNGTVYTGSESRAYIDIAVSLWKHGFIDAIVTGPVSKGLIEKSGCPFTGHTEYIADKINEQDPFMLMYSDEYRVLLATTHLPLASVVPALSADRLLATIETGYRAISAIDGKPGKLVITGLDPHCGDDGAIGNFDRHITAEAVARAKRKGIDITGPLSADTLFMPDIWRQYSLAIVHYHDQGLIPFKMLAFDNGVNITLGLSVIRTSVDHGTAFDIAGKNAARHSSMVAALKSAQKLFQNRNN